MCDIFEGFGIALRNIVGTTFHPDGTQESFPISENRKQVWLEFCEALENRERKVASLYAHEIQEIGDLVSSAAKVKDLEKIKEQARKARVVLTSQKADFESLAESFRSKPN